MAICDNCIHDEVCGLEGHLDEALTFCANKAVDGQPKATCRMIPLEPDCRGYTDIFICTHCHQHIHLGFICKEYSGNFCIECGAELKEAETEKG